jgi:ABC-type branched-subunit amino acid transport system ATPase component
MMLLELRNVFAGYLRGVNVLRGVNLHVNQGEKIAEGSPQIIQSDPVVLDAYLGD